MLNLEVIEKDFEDIFQEIHETTNDFDTLLIGTRILEIARDRLDGDLDNKDIKTEYNKLEKIIKELYSIIEKYV